MLGWLMALRRDSRKGFLPPEPGLAWTDTEPPDHMGMLLVRSHSTLNVYAAQEVHRDLTPMNVTTD